MSGGQNPVEALRTEKHRKDPSSASGISNFTRTISKSIGIRRKSSQQDDTTARMPPKQRMKHSLSTPDGEGPLRTNGNSGSRSSNSTNHLSSNAPSVSQPETNLGPLAQELRDASEQLSKIQEAIRAITTSCIQHADDITQIPEVRERYENLRKEVEEKDIMIADQKTAIDVLNRMASEKEDAAADDVKSNLAERERLEQEKVKLDQQKRAVVEALEKKELELKDEATKTLSRQGAELDNKFMAQMKGLEKDLEKRKKEQDEELENLKAKIKKDLDIISKLKVRTDKLRLELNTEIGRREDIDQAKDGYKRDKEQLTEKLKDLQKEFSLNSEPLEYYQGEFLNTSRAIHDISTRYLARDLSKEEVTRLPSVTSATDSTFSDVPFSNTETSKQLRIAHAQRVIADAIYNIVWQPFSSDVTTADSKLSQLLQDIGAAVGSGRSADVWRAVTMRALESMSAANTQLQHSLSQALGATHSTKSREDKLVELVLSILRPLLDTSSLPLFKADLLQIAKQAISVWDSAQADERTFTINPKLNQENKRDWKIAALDYAPLYANGGSQVSGSRRRNPMGIFTLFPIITATKRGQVQKAGHGLPGSWPNQDEQQLVNAEVTLVHDGLGLPQESDIVQEGIAEREEFKKMRLAHEELWDQKFAQKVAERGHSRNNSMVGTISGPPSPTAIWNKNKLSSPEDET